MPFHLNTFSRRLRCSYPGCSVKCLSQSALTKHVWSKHSTSNILSAPQPPATPTQIDADAQQTPSPSSEGHNHHDTSQDYVDPPDIEPTCTRSQPGSSSSDQSKRIWHPHLTADPCDVHGQPLPPNSPPTVRDAPEPGNWFPFVDQAEFHLADLLFRKVEMSAACQNELYEILDMLLNKHDDQSPFRSAKDMYETIDSAHVGGVPWKCLTTSFSGELGSNPPSWKLKSYEIWYRDPDLVLKSLLDNPDFDGEFDYQPYIQLDHKGKRCWSDFMSANFAWRHSTDIYNENPDQNRGAMYCSIITGSDKTTVSVATGQVEYHPGYLSIGNIRNNVRRAHRGAVVPFIFFAIPKSERKYDNDPEFRKFKRQLYHASIAAVLQPIRNSMSIPVVRRCPDGHFRRVIFDLGPVIADYPEQVMLACIVQGWCPKCTALPKNLDHCEHATPRDRTLTEELIKTFDPGTLWDVFGIDDELIPFTNDFPRADIHELLSPDLLHQLIKGTFKDHLVEWVGDYLVITHGKAKANIIMDEIDCRIAAVPAFPGLRRFPDGRRFKQWTGDDSKALMKVYLPVLADFVPLEILKTFSTFLDFCYLARHTHFTEDTLACLDNKLQSFHHFREVFRVNGVREDFSLPRQHSLKHYTHSIQEFGAPYGLCSSITESRHITAVKKPWRRSNRYQALGQMLITNQRLDKLAALQVDYVARGMLPPAHDTAPPDDEDTEGGPNDELVTGSVVLARRRAPGYPSGIDELAEHVDVPDLCLLARRFLYEQLHPDSTYRVEDVPSDALPLVQGAVSVFHSAIATFYAPNDLPGLHGMYSERIRCTPNWHGQGPRRDCAFVIEDQGLPGFQGMSVVRLRLLLSFKHDGRDYPCALVEWFDKAGQRPDPNTGLWVVRPDLRGRQEQPFMTVVHIDCFLRAAHLIPVFGQRPLPKNFKYQYSLGAFRAFYVNKYIDYHSFELLSDL